MSTEDPGSGSIRTVAGATFFTASAWEGNLNQYIVTG